MKKNKDITIRVTPEFKEQVNSLAKREGLTVSSYIYNLLTLKLRG